MHDGQTVEEAVKLIDCTTTDKYYQHNPGVENGKEAFNNAPKLLRNLSEIGLKTTFDVKKTISAGDFVLTFSCFRLPLV
jgi:predicted SnoaL-like aldol condensation-catalyzing enzyme